MTEHSELVAEMCSIEKMATPERLKHAKKRRSQQLKRFANYEKQLEKDKSKKNKQSQNQKRQHRKKARVKFIHNIMLLEAAARSDIDEVRRLLMAGVSADVTNEDGLTALHQCCIDDNEDMLKLLLEFGANVNARDSEMWTPLHAAATCGHVHLCKLLIDKGAELLAVNADGNMPYDICEDEVALDYIETEMAKRGITQDEIDEKRLETERKMLKDLKKMAEEGRSLEYRDSNRATPLHIAAANGYIEVVEFLLDHHVSLDVRDEDSWMPIHAAACWLQPEVLEILVKNGADLDAKTLRNGETPFDLAEDPDVKQKILDLKDELETHRASRSSQPRNRRVNTRGHTGYNHSHYSSTGSLYSSNGSLNEKPASSSHGSNHRSSNASSKQTLPNPASASLRRTSMRGEKRPLFKKEAKEEALHFGMFSMNNDEDDIADINDENKENLPATNIDDVKLIIEDEPDKHLNERKERSTKHNSDSLKLSKGAVAPNNAKNRESQKAKETVVEAPKPEPQRTRSAENETRKSDPSRRSHEPEPIHVHMGREGSGSQIKSSSSPNSNHSRDTRPPPERNTRESQSKSERETQDPRPQREMDTRENGENKTAVNPQGKQTQGRTPSFRKNRDSQRRTHEDQSPSDSNTNNYPVSGVRYPSGTPTGTLADLKKHRAENHKFGNSIDTQVQNLFLHSLSGDGKKYSTGGSSSPASPPSQQPSNKETSQNGRNVKNNNNNNSTPTRPPSYISDSGPLRRFSAPTSAPVIGDDDKFKSNCCVVM